MKMLLAFLAREVSGRFVINVTELCDKKINFCVPFRLIGAQGLEISIWNTSQVMEAYKQSIQEFKRIIF